MACSTTRLAITVKSRGVPARFGLRERLARHGPFWHEPERAAHSADFKLTHYHQTSDPRNPWRCKAEAGIIRSHIIQARRRA